MTPVVGGRWLHDAFGIAWSDHRRGGPLEAKWSLPTGMHGIKPRSVVELRDGAECVWSGVLVEPTSGSTDYAARGWASVLDEWPALNASSQPTGNLKTALDEQYAAVGLSGHDIPSTGQVEKVPDAGYYSLGELLDLWAHDEDVTWWVDPDTRRLRYAADPASATLAVRTDSARLGYSGDGAATRLLVTFLDADNAGATDWTIVSDAAMESQVGVVWGELDLTGRGNLTEAAAQTKATRRLTRPVFVDKLTLDASNTTTPGGVGIDPRSVRAFPPTRINVLGWDDLNIAPGDVTVVVESTEHAADAAFVDVTPVGAPIRRPRDVIRQAIKGRKRKRKD